METYYKSASSLRGGPQVELWDNLHGSEAKHDFKGLLLVGSEQALSSAFERYLDVLHLNGLLARVVVDEAHLALTSGDYRPNLQSLLYLRRHSVPLFLFSGTLSPPALPQLASVYGLPCPTVVRSKTDRPNLRYKVG